jgi:hypothetical protein
VIEGDVAVPTVSANVTLSALRLMVIASGGGGGGEAVSLQPAVMTTAAALDRTPSSPDLAEVSPTGAELAGRVLVRKAGEPRRGAAARGD